LYLKYYTTLPVVNWFDSESDFPEFSSISLSSNMGVNVDQFSVNPQINLALGVNEEGMKKVLVYCRSSLGEGHSGR